MATTNSRALGLAAGGLAVLGAAVGGLWAWSRPALPAPVAGAPPEYVAEAVPAARNALPDYRAAAKALRLPPRERRADLWADLDAAATLPPEGAALAAANQPALARLHAGRGKPDLQFMPPGHTTRTPTPDLTNFPHLGRIGAADIRRRLALGDHAGAFERALDLYALGRRMRHVRAEGIIFPLVGRSVDDAAHGALRHDAARVLAAPTPALAAFLRALNALDGLERGVEEGLRAERDLQLRTLRAGFDLGDKIDRETAAEFGLTRFSDPTIAVVKDAFDRQIACLQRRDFDGARREVAALEALDPWKLEVGRYLHRDVTYGLVMASVLLPSYAGGGEKLLIAEGRSDALRVWLARELHRRERGAPPATLAALVPRWLPAAPADPFAPARPLAYRDGMLWSVGLDGRDDGGRAAMPLAPTRTDYDRGVRKVRDGDFVFLTAAGLP